EVAAGGVPGDVHVDGGHVDAADVQETGGAGREPGDFGARGQVARRVAALPVLGFGQLRREQGIDEVLAQHERAAPGYDVTFKAACSVPLPAPRAGSGQRAADEGEGEVLQVAAGGIR